uniref:Dehydrogenase/reductase SDR family member 2, mitochondrial-like n=1 Tax=Ursus maritimus TaxID=29073 RepID=A0A452UKP5_URSMA
MFRAASWAFRGLRRSSVPLSARTSSNRADRSCALAEKVAVITGSTKGIGFTIARRLAEDGAHVVISSRKQQNVDRAVAELQGEGLSVTGTVCHVGKAEDRERLVATALEHCGRVDFLVCVAGVNPLVGSTLGASEQVWDKVRTGVGSYTACVVLRPPFFSGCSGDISSCQFQSSLSTAFPFQKLGVYNTSKTALLGLCKSLAVELAPKGIRVNCLVPGIIKTEFSQVKRQRLDFPVCWLFGEPEECAGIVCFLRLSREWGHGPWCATGGLVENMEVGSLRVQNHTGKLAQEMRKKDV